jgi:hypothetical protein
MKLKAWILLGLGILLLSSLLIHTHLEQVSKWSHPLPVSTVESLGTYLQSTSVTISTPDGEGSASLFERKIDGNVYQFAWTAGHVVFNMHTNNISKNIALVRHHYSNGRQAGFTLHKATVIAWSHPDSGYDLALLLVDGRFDLPNGGVEFNQTMKLPHLGMDIFHVGSFLGQEGHNSFSVGIISHIGRVLRGLPYEYDQTSAPVYPGSSGGGVFDRDGKYIGMVVRRADSTFNFIVPIRLMRIWVVDEHLTWALDSSVSMPSLRDILGRKVNVPPIPIVETLPIPRQENQPSLNHHQKRRMFPESD